jgi:hypothetical protein
MKRVSSDLKNSLARGILAACAIPQGADFHSLTTAQVESLLAWANYHNYRAPKYANGSRLRCFHNLMQRRAKGP